MRKGLFLFIIAAFISGLFRPYSFADDCMVGKTPDGVFPINSTDVVMVSEDINVNLENQKVICSFEFKNTGEKSIDIQMGFPAEWDESSEEAKNFLSDKMVFKNFRTFINDVEIKNRKETGVKNDYVSKKDLRLDYKSWYVFDVHFNANETVKIKNTYTTIPPQYSTGDILTGYILKTGALWKGNIGHAKVTFELGNIPVYKFSPDCSRELRFENNSFVWEKYDFEPDHDLKIMCMAGRYDGDLTYKNEAKLYEKVNKTTDLNLLKEYYMDAFYYNSQSMIVYILSKLPPGTITYTKPKIFNLSLEPDGGNLRLFNPEEYNYIFEDNSKGWYYYLNYSIGDDEGDIDTIGFVIYHFENEVKVIDYPKVNQQYYQYMFELIGGNRITLKENVKYTVELTAVDSKGLTSVKTIEYLDKGIEKNSEIKSVEPVKNKDKKSGNSYLIFIISGATITILASALILLSKLNKTKFKDKNS